MKSSRTAGPREPVILLAFGREGGYEGTYHMGIPSGRSPCCRPGSAEEG